MATDRVRAPRARTLLPLLLSLSAGAAACDAPIAVPDEPRYDVTELTGGLVYHWSPGATISVYPDTTGLDPLAFDIAGAVQNAARVWGSAVYYREVSLKRAYRPSDADIIVHYKFVPRLVNTVVNGGDCDLHPVGVGGYTLFCPDPGDAPVLPLKGDGAVGRVKIDIFVDPYQVSSAYLEQRGVNRYQAFYSLVAHEIGHALGIGGHSDEQFDLMYPVPTAPRPTWRDAAALQSVLHRKADIRF